ncbi:hypothetical protein [Halapricum desulfuricans]|uniref:hypothetical protein n=1 Tax=Halapricum desulfuricans TaxID=2841257 RepID=UPI001E53B0F2|nr:hypothetical protein [Halapricum desulfuricans]
MAKDPDWARVLDVLYADLHTLSEGLASDDKEKTEFEPQDDDINTLSKETGLSSEELITQLESMREAGLVEKMRIETTPRSVHYVGLTEKGLSIGHERAVSKRQNETNRAVVLLTLVLLVITALGNFPDPIIRFTGSIIVLIAILALLILTDLGDIISI